MANKVDIQARRGQAMERTKKTQARLRLLEYRVEAGDILLLSGQYNGQKVTELWSRGENERDYIVKNLCMRNDEAVMEIIRGLCGN